MNASPKPCSASLLFLALITGWTVSAAAAEDGVADLVDKVRFSIFRVEWTGIAASKRKDGTTGEKEVGAAGTGFLIKENGQVYIVTNHHVVDTSNLGLKYPAKFTVRTNSYTDTDKEPCEIVGVDALSDLAVLKCSDASRYAPTIFVPLPFADPKTIRTGMGVVVVGFALAMEGEATVSQGIISARERDQSGGMISGLLQTDAATNPGNSGGPWLNRNGEVIGVHTYGENSELVSDERGNLSIAKREGVNKARSVETAAPLVRRIIREGAIRRASLGGLKVESVPPVVAGLLKLPTGVRVSSVPEGASRINASVYEHKWVSGPRPFTPYVRPASGRLMDYPTAPGGRHEQELLLPPDQNGFDVDDFINGIKVEDKFWPVRNAGDLNNVLGMVPAGTKVRIYFTRFQDKASPLSGSHPHLEDWLKSIGALNDWVLPSNYKPTKMTCVLDTKL